MNRCLACVQLAYCARRHCFGGYKVHQPTAWSPRLPFLPDNGERKPRDSVALSIWRHCTPKDERWCRLGPISMTGRCKKASCPGPRSVRTVLARASFQEALEVAGKTPFQDPARDIEMAEDQRSCFACSFLAALSTSDVFCRHRWRTVLTLQDVRCPFEYSESNEMITSALRFYEALMHSC